ncbi:hypothetical protein [Pantoea agglomerans]|uniref:hypothetical protein n=1 Tax=Enterobacter agglomerans TaxID=549 RepID=UPI0024136748|nr:hypothetical protein [Pantoea agglomerans]
MSFVDSIKYIEQRSVIDGDGAMPTKSAHFTSYSGSRIKIETPSKIISLSPAGFTGDISISGKFCSDKNAASNIASTNYLSDFPSCFFLNKKTPG